MTINILSPAEFLYKSPELVIFDTRSPGEFSKGHIPGAVNLPLFNDDERAEIGTLYKEKGREAAVLRGLEITGPKLAGFVRSVKSFTEKKQILMHCWRGGMRSSSMAWLLETAGFHVFLLEGGYKSYRKYIREQFSIKAEKLVVLGGMTGTGKTDILAELKKSGEQVIDLEMIANHKGSAFGTIGMNEQPSNEQFENDLYRDWSKLDLGRQIWLEDESKKIGKVEINDPLFLQMREAKLVKISLPREMRIQRLINDYCRVSPEELIMPVKKISRKLGGLREMEIIDHISNGEFHDAISKVLDYYDRGYGYGNSKRDQNRVFDIELTENSPLKAALILKEFTETSGFTEA